ncbi:MAG: tRNA glutamyl-Q(34) synthetase GluQRS [Robiginitomaculum sp.]|nr:MAG: tRNA glutamyl-Q(34) synthetase GluQRS [Robiginitomaculum sp.]
MNDIVTRFAPSPSGYLHLGHAASAAKAFGYAREHDGICLLRIEDIDTTRCKPEFERAIYEDLAWLGFKWPSPVRRQTDHLADYGAVLDKLRDIGLVYRCFKTRKEILNDIARAPHYSGEPYTGPHEPMDAGLEQELVAEGKPYAWRLSLYRAQEHLGRQYNRLAFTDNGEKIRAVPAVLGDVVLARKDVGTSYHIACCHDDALQGVTDIVRGVDLLESTHIHRLLQELMGWPVPCHHHHALLTDAAGKRYAKRDKSLTLRALRQSGATPDNIHENIQANILAQAQELG